VDARQDPAVSRALQSSDTEGVLSQISSHIVEFYLQPCALFVGATAAQVGWLAGCTRLLNALAQYASPAAVRAGRGRRSLLIAGAVLQGAALVPIALVTLHPGRGALIVVFGGALAFQALGGFMYPAWASLMSEYLPESRRASYFGRRGRLLAA
jgi:MFS family permease